MSDESRVQVPSKYVASAMRGVADQSQDKRAARIEGCARTAIESVLDQINKSAGAGEYDCIVLVEHGTEEGIQIEVLALVTDALTQAGYRPEWINNKLDATGRVRVDHVRVSWST